MAEPYNKPGEPTNPDIENVEGADDCSFESVASTQILSPIEEIISETIRLERGQPIENQPAGHGEVEKQPAGHGEVISVITGQPRSTGDDNTDLGMMSQAAAPDQ
ncbi:uncharacterized protein LOC143895987 [Temnothorax americanus]|uniref:uncharacterized protein LOC143895987 n=1 Tax=Temnothorax americanus TaxID=1964332 RepID=UPI00406889E5